MCLLVCLIRRMTCGISSRPCEPRTATAWLFGEARRSSRQRLSVVHLKRFTKLISWKLYETRRGCEENQEFMHIFYFSKIRKRNKTNKIYNMKFKHPPSERVSIRITSNPLDCERWRVECTGNHLPLVELARARAQHSFWCDFFRSRITFFFLVSFWLHFHEDIRSAPSHATQSHFFSHFFLLLSSLSNARFLLVEFYDEILRRVGKKEAEAARCQMCSRQWELWARLRNASQTMTRSFMCVFRA